MTALTVKNLSSAYQKKIVLDSLTFSIEEGTLTGVVGPNGAGKSTMIKAILGLQPKMTGSIEFFNGKLKKLTNHLGYVPQRGAVDWDFPTNVLDVVTMGLYGQIGWFQYPGKKHRQLAFEALEKVNMAEYANRQISQLSGGQQQRVFLARALVQDADLYFMDEPFAGVDAKTEKTIIAVLKELKSKGKTVLVVHHDLQTVPAYFDHVLLLNKQLIAYGPTNETFTKSFLKKTYGGEIHWMGSDQFVESL
ncbi:metal ABC transporter ATP-binding protein [Jeotgalibacillus campisalis]|uniref:Manganese ABC transporter ATP-binding protein n=1 Tax=Jeotgalibacillus campisalis TaxID=220754 RepID=A0A0C2VVL4_9BACL|nr:metal ABC transporter ATP-binding protein [Jeotgalibacillus campisalis]KIL48003.1 manganese ABC transporter ATP-binding protein [Jeotgalibacillus campisalis]